MPKQQSINKKLPLMVLDKCIDSNIWIVMKGQHQFSGVLRGFDDYFNMVLEQITQIWKQNGKQLIRKVQSMLLNGHDIMVPGVNPYHSLSATI